MCSTYPEMVLFTVSVESKYIALCSIHYATLAFTFNMSAAGVLSSVTDQQTLASFSIHSLECAVFSTLHVL